MNGQEKREKVMKGMDTFLGDKCSMFTCDCYILDCPYAGSDCMIEMIRDAYEVLKAQEPVEPIIDETGVFYCANCKKQPVGYKNIDREIFRHNLYCPNCGKAVKWE